MQKTKRKTKAKQKEKAKSKLTILTVHGKSMTVVIYTNTINSIANKTLLTYKNKNKNKNSRLMWCMLQCDHCPCLLLFSNLNLLAAERRRATPRRVLC